MSLFHKICKLLWKMFTFFFSFNVRMIGKTINFDNKKINNSNFYRKKKLFKIDDIDVNKVLISNKEP